MIMYEATLALLNGVVRQLALSFSCSKGDYVIQAQNSEVNEIHEQASCCPCITTRPCLEA